MNSRISEHGAISSNNYISSFSLYRINKHIDLFKMSIKEGIKERLIHQYLQINGFRVGADELLEKGKYKRNRRYESLHDPVKVNLIYGLKEPKPFMPDLSIIVHDPHKHFCNLLQSFFDYNKIKPTLSGIELTFDFYTNDLSRAFKFLKSHFYLKYTDSVYEEYETTFYANTRGSNHGAKIYIKNDQFVRLELKLSRNAIRRLSVGSVLEEIEQIDPFRYFRFKYFNSEKLLKFYLNHPLLLPELESRRDVKELMFIRWMRSRLHQKQSLLWKVLTLKNEGYRKYIRYFPDYVELNNLFKNEVTCQFFIKDRETQCISDRDLRNSTAGQPFSRRYTLR